jgi:betaine-aldehyde dehydrogenase
VTRLYNLILLPGLGSCIAHVHKDRVLALYQDRAGTIWVNTFLEGYPELPFGGYKESGIGREFGRFSVDAFTELKSVQMHLGPRTSWWMTPPDGAGR